MSAAILCGGQGKRMGGVDKRELVVDGLPIIERQLKVLGALTDSIALVGPPGERELSYLGDAIGSQGPMDGVLAALRWSTRDWVFVIACDMPYVSGPLVEALLAHAKDPARMVGIDLDPAEPLFAFYHCELAPWFEARLRSGIREARAFWRDPLPQGKRVLLPESEARQFDANLASLRNLNRPEDLLRTQSPIE